MKYYIKEIFCAIVSLIALSANAVHPNYESTHLSTINVNGFYVDPTWRDISYREMDLKIKGEYIIAYKDPFTGMFVDCNVKYHKMTVQEKGQMKLSDSHGRSYELYVGDCNYMANIGKLTVYFTSNNIGENVDNKVYPLSEVDSKPTLDLKKYGTSDLIRYIQKRINYPFEAADKNIQGKVVITFIVNLDGTISDIKVVQSAHRLLDNAVKDAIRKITKCEPAIKNNKEVITIIEFPFTFKLAK